METICRDIEILALVFPEVAFTVSTIRQPSEITDRVLHIPKVPKVYHLISCLPTEEPPDVVRTIRISSRTW